MNEYWKWAELYPQAAAHLAAVLSGAPWAEGPAELGKSEAASQQNVRLLAARQGAMAWRNNVGATPASVKVACPACRFKHELRRPPLRYGLANDSAKLNAQVKSSDLILAIPRLITPAMVGSTMAQFGAVECKRPGWAFSGNKHETGQAAWLALVAKMGGFATFSTGGLQL